MFHFEVEKQLFGLKPMNCPGARCAPTATSPCAWLTLACCTAMSSGEGGRGRDLPQPPTADAGS
ncbi:threonyl-tRNA synthetase [Haematococcus lacustris]|uniref:Threonyl-tRNA synthetase n=1 Tax=Haematococcus lacustris TaxID=44745 RepID=A0A6A0ALA9_HAELA|nr:threonyl-tRNA synthetase [Haematococcus lacustris]